MVRLPEGALVPMYLVHSYLYYIEETPIITDTEYDRLCKKLLNSFDTLTHRHKHLVSKEALQAGTGYHISEDDYPSITKHSAVHLRDRY
jgi:NAD-dependent DNA ligase